MAADVSGLGVDVPISIRRIPSALMPANFASLARLKRNSSRRLATASYLLTVAFCQVLPSRAR